MCMTVWQCYVLVVWINVIERQQCKKNSFLRMWWIHHGFVTNGRRPFIDTSYSWRMHRPWNIVIIEIIKSDTVGVGMLLLMNVKFTIGMLKTSCLPTIGIFNCPCRQRLDKILSYYFDNCVICSSIYVLWLSLRYFEAFNFFIWRRI